MVHFCILDKHRLDSSCLSGNIKTHYQKPTWNPILQLIVQLNGLFLNLLHILKKIKNACFILSADLYFRIGKRMNRRYMDPFALLKTVFSHSLGFVPSVSL